MTSKTPERYETGALVDPQGAKPSISYSDSERGGAQSFVGCEAVNVFACAVIASGLRLYAKTGMKPNRAYTPSAMMLTALERAVDAMQDALDGGEFWRENFAEADIPAMRAAIAQAKGEA